MAEHKVYTAIGLMSGTSLDGEIDVALIRTDGHDFVEPLDFKPFPYDKSVRDKVRACFGKREPDEQTREAEDLVTDLHIQAVKASGFEANIIGFHGQTITHDPANGLTWQLGDGQRLARETGVGVVCDLRQADVKAGGQGAPLIPLYHRALAHGRSRPLAMMNLGGVANVTFIGANENLLAFDTGPANAMIDDYVFKKTGQAYDVGGELAAAGQIHQKLVDHFLSHAYFQKQPPKSLDRNDFADFMTRLPETMEDAVATLTAFSVQSVARSVEHMSEAPQEWLVCGGGRKNAVMMAWLSEVLDVPVRPVEQVGWNGDAIEAQGFGYLAVRSKLGLPITLPKTTGVCTPMTGGVIYDAAA